MKSVLSVLILFLCLATVEAQHVIKGKVIGADDRLPLPQVSVFITGTDQGVPTDANGEFTLEVDTKKITLTFRYLGFITQKVRPKFSGRVLIKLKPDCTHHHYHSSSYFLYGGSDLSNNGLMCRLELPTLRFYKSITSAFELSGLGGQEFQRADVKIWDLYFNCEWDLNLNTSYRNYQISNTGLDFRSWVFSPHIGLNNTDWIVGIGKGTSTLGDTQHHSTGFQLGLERRFNFHLGDWVEIPVKVTATRWDSFWDIESSVELVIWPYGFKAGYNRINNFNQFFMMVGIGISP